MIPVGYQNPVRHDEQDLIHTSFSHRNLAMKIGGDLRDVYGELKTDSQPDHLIELASRIDDSLFSGGDTG